MHELPDYSSKLEGHLCFINILSIVYTALTGVDVTVASYQCRNRLSLTFIQGRRQATTGRGPPKVQQNDRYQKRRFPDSYPYQFLRSLSGFYLSSPSQIFNNLSGNISASGALKFE